MVVMVALALLAGYALGCRHQPSNGFYWDRMHHVIFMMHVCKCGSYVHHVFAQDSEWQSYVWWFGGQWWWWQARTCLTVDTRSLSACLC
eukprot:4850208-Amphidinium_carterae.1